MTRHQTLELRGILIMFGFCATLAAVLVERFAV